MTNRLRNAITAAAALLVAVSPAALAGISSAVITYEPTSLSVPVLGGPALLMLAALLALVAYRLRGQGILKENRLLGVALVVTVIAAGASGTKLVYATNFGPAPGLPLSSETGGTVNVGPTGTSCLYNQTGVELAITGISARGNNTIDTTGAGKDGFCPETYLDNGGGVNGGEAPVCSDSPSTRLGPQKACSVTVLQQLTPT